MGKVIAKFTLTNYTDLIARDLKVLKGKPRTVEVEALVDTGATRLYLKPSIIKKLGLTKTGTVNSRTTNGNRERGVYSPVKMELMGRSGEFAWSKWMKPSRTSSARSPSNTSTSSWIRKTRSSAPTPSTERSG